LGALSILPEFLRNTASDSGQVVDYRDWHIQLGRRFRALKLWAVIRCYGVSGLQQHIRTHVELAQQFASWVAADERFEVTAPHPLSLVCFRLRADDARNTALMHSLNGSGELYLTHTRIGGRVSLRLAIGGTYTGREHVERAWHAIGAAAS
jgi:aromatic-L-amino-acid decarboxylase